MQEQLSRATHGAVAENSYLASDAVDEDPMDQLRGHSNRAVRSCTLQTLPACDPEENFADTRGLVAGFSLNAGVAAKAHECKKLVRLCRYIARPAISEQRLSRTTNGNIRYELKTPYRDGATHVLRSCT